MTTKKLARLAIGLFSVTTTIYAAAFLPWPAVLLVCLSFYAGFFFLYLARG